jgi:cation-transporting ATPase 13A1
VQANFSKGQSFCKRISARGQLGFAHDGEIARRWEAAACARRCTAAMAAASCAGKGMSVALYRKATALGGYGREHAPFVVLHAYALYWCASTMGAPHAAAEEARSELEWKLRTELEEDEEFDESKLPALPSVLLPGFWALFALVAFLCLHGLMVLGKGWSVRFCAALTYSASDLDGADTVMVVPRKHRGKAELVEMHWTTERKGAPRQAFFMFQRRKWLLSDVGVFEKLPLPTDRPLREYHAAGGLVAEADVDAARELHGPNRFELPSPTFLPMFKKQLSQPLSVFQLFSVLLWCLDDYWQYSLFTFAMMLVFEGTVVFSRLKSMSVLRGMGNEARQVHARRGGKWVQISTEELLPGDIVSIVRAEKAEVVPADVLLLRGTAVVNEATLTGESVPQMKEALSLASEESDEEEVRLNLKGAHKLHIMYSGSTVMQHSKGSPTGSVGGQLTSPDGGCVCFVLRTGFRSSQGKLVRMIEFSSENVSGDQREAGLLLAFLLVFALTASGYVLKRGLEDKDRSQYDLLLHCILIITSVIPPELPMQTALAVNSSIVTLMKSQIFCTEPFRIPNAGKLDTCLFDKTGTITTDELTAVGVAGWSPKQSDGAVSSSAQTVATMLNAPVACCAVLAGCQSLVDIDGKLMGDPVEEAAIKAICWKYDGAKGVATPDKGSPWAKTSPGSGPAPRVEVLQRHHFASKLQRMSVVASVQPGGLNEDGTAAAPQLWCLVKGSPEKIRTLLSDDAESMPAWYDATHEKLARDGMRVIAMAYRRIENTNLSYSDAKSKPRSWAESDLTFAGFVAFRCLVRRDSAQVLNELQASDHRVIMITGDAALTGIHVAAETDIITSDRSRVLVLTAKEDKGVAWTNAETGAVTKFDADALPQLSAESDLVMTGQTLSLAAEAQASVWEHLRCVKVFARMAPEEKEKVISSINSRGHFTMMMGDGANDVGALKQAHVGCALLTGFGSINVDKREGANADDAAPKASPGRERDPRIIKARAARKEVLMEQPVGSIVIGLRNLGSKPSDDAHCFEKEELVELLLDMEAKQQSDAAMVASGEKAAKPVAQTPAQKRAAMFAKRKAELEQKARERKAAADKRIQALRDRGGSMMDIMQLTKQLAQEEMEAAKALAGGAAGHGFEASAALSAAMMDPEMDDLGMEAPMVKLGDASIASPFTSKMPSIKAALDIVRQGRCTLLTTIQMYMILALNCLISAYSLSVLYLDGIKYGDKQMTATGILMSISFITISQATSLPQLASVRPLTSVFHPAMFCSMVGQFCVHLSTMVYAHGMAKPLMPTDFKVDLRELDEAGNNTFKPSILNTVVFYMSTMQQVCVFAVNYKGRPFMQGLTENAPLLYSLGLCGTLAVACATELFPRFNAYLQLEPLPDAEFRNTILGLLAVDVVATVLWDRLMSWIFASHIFSASMEGWSRQDFVTIFKLLGVAGTVIWWLGNNVETLEELEKEMAELDLEEDSDESLSMAAQAAGGPAGAIASWLFGEEALNEAVGTLDGMLGEDAAAKAAGARCGPGTRWDAESELCVLQASDRSM